MSDEEATARKPETPKGRFDFVANSQRKTTPERKAEFNEMAISLSDCFADTSNTLSARKAAGVRFKKELFANKLEGILALEATTKQTVEDNCLKTFDANEREISEITAQILAVCDCTLNPADLRKDLDSLLAKAKAGPNGQDIVPIVQAIGYICLYAAERIPQPKIDDAITTLLESADFTDNDADVSAAALSTLWGLLGPIYFKHIVQGYSDKFRDKAIAATAGPSVAIQVLGFEGLQKIVDVFCEEAESCLLKAHKVANTSLHESTNKVRVKVTRFIIAVCEALVQLDWNPSVPQSPNRDVVTRELAGFADIIFRVMQGEDIDQDQVGIAFKFIAQVTKTEILSSIEPLIESALKSDDPRKSSVGMAAFGYTFQGLDSVRAAHLDGKFRSSIIELFSRAPEIEVKTRAIWALGVVLRDMPDELIFDGSIANSLIPVLVEGIADAQAQISSESCLALIKLMERLKELADDQGGNKSGLLKEKNEIIVSALLKKIQQPTGESNDRENACVALEAYIGTVNLEGYSLIEQVVVPVTKWQKEIIENLGKLADPNKRSNDTLCLNIASKVLAASIYAEHDMFTKDNTRPIKDNADKIAEAADNRQTTLEAAFTLLGPLASVLDPQDYSVLHQHFFPLLYASIESAGDFKAFDKSLSTIGEMCKAVGKDSIDSWTQVMKRLSEGLKNSEFGGEATLSILQNVGDMALGMKGEFGPYLGGIMNLLASACLDLPDPFKDDSLGSIHQLRLAGFSTLGHIVEALAPIPELRKDVENLVVEIIIILPFAISGDEIKTPENIVQSGLEVVLISANFYKDDKKEFWVKVVNDLLKMFAPTSGNYSRSTMRVIKQLQEFVTSASK